MIKAKKKYGQNFLSDKSVINDIVRNINPQQNDNILEIGPGSVSYTHLTLPTNREV